MGLFDRFRAKRQTVATESHPNEPLKRFSSPTNPFPLGIPEFLSVLSFPEQRISRREALTVPTVVRGRNLLCSIATLPLQLIKSDTYEVVDSALLRQIDIDVPNVVTIAQTVEDLIFEGISWWKITSRDFDGFPTAATHLDPLNVTTVPPADYFPQLLPSGLDPRESKVVWVNGKPTDPRDVIRFDSPNGALLVDGSRVIRRAILLDKAAKMYAADPRPLDYFSPAPGAEQIGDDDAQQIINSWLAARQKRSTAWVPESLEYNSVDTPSPQQLQLVELTNQASLEIAILIGIDPEDVGLNVTSRTYFNAQDRRLSRVNETLAPYVRAITDRLSMGDVTRRGYCVEFDLTDYLKADPLTRSQVQQAYISMGVLSPQEVREAEGIPGNVPSAPAPVIDVKPTTVQVPPMDQQPAMEPPQ